MTDTVDKNKNDESSSHSILDFLIRIVPHAKKLPICQEGEHDWVLIDGTGYDYKADYYLCEKCELKISRREFEL